MGGDKVTTIPGYVSLADFDYPQRDKKAAHSPQYKLLRQAISDGDVDGFQHSTSGRWLVNREQADKLLIMHVAKVHGTPVTVNRNENDSAATALDRIATALEALVEKLEKAEIVERLFGDQRESAGDSACSLKASK